MKKIILVVLAIVALITFHIVSLFNWSDYRLFAHYSTEVLSVSMYGVGIVFLVLGGLGAFFLSLYFVYINISDMIKTKAKFSWGCMGVTFLLLCISLVFLSQTLNCARHGSMKIEEIAMKHIQISISY